MGVNRDVTRRHIESEYRCCAATPICGIVRGWPLSRSVAKWVGDDARLYWWAPMEAGIVADTTEVFTNHGVNSRKAVT